MNIRIEFDGGTSCNVPSRGFGNGYGSYKINDEPIHRCNFNRPMSANAAEIFTLAYAVKAVRDRDLDVSKIRLSIFGDSKIALSWANKVSKPLPLKFSRKSTSEFQDAIHQLKWALSGFQNVHSQWRSRAYSVQTFGH